MELLSPKTVSELLTAAAKKDLHPNDTEILLTGDLLTDICHRIINIEEWIRRTVEHP